MSTSEILLQNCITDEGSLSRKAKYLVCRPAPTTWASFSYPFFNRLSWSISHTGLSAPYLTNNHIQLQVFHFLFVCSNPHNPSVIRFGFNELGSSKQLVVFTCPHSQLCPWDLQEKKRTHINLICSCYGYFPMPCPIINQNQGKCDWVCLQSTMKIAHSESLAILAPFSHLQIFYRGMPYSIEKHCWFLLCSYKGGRQENLHCGTLLVE